MDLEDYKGQELDGLLDDCHQVCRRFWGNFGKSLSLSDEFVRAALSRSEVRKELGGTGFTTDERDRIDRLGEFRWHIGGTYNSMQLWHLDA